MAMSRISGLLKSCQRHWQHRIEISSSYPVQHSLLTVPVVEVIQLRCKLCTRLEQQDHCCLVLPTRGPKQRRPPVIIGLVQVRVMLWTRNGDGVQVRIGLEMGSEQKR